MAALAEVWKLNRAAKKGGASGGPRLPKFTRRIVIEALLPGGERSYVVAYGTHDAPVRAQGATGHVRAEVAWRTLIANLGGAAVRVERHLIDGLDGKLGTWESLYDALRLDADGVFAANDPRAGPPLDIEV